MFKMMNFAGQLQANIDEIDASAQKSLAQAQRKIEQDMHQLRQDDAVMWKDTEQVG